MTSLKDQLRSYGNYHRNPTNKLTHFVGVPLERVDVMGPSNRTDGAEVIRFAPGETLISEP